MQVKKKLTSRDQAIVPWKKCPEVDGLNREAEKWTKN